MQLAISAIRIDISPSLLATLSFASIFKDINYNYRPRHIIHFQTHPSTAGTGKYAGVVSRV